MHFKSIATFFSEEIGANAKKSVWSTIGQHTVPGSCGVRTQRRSHHWLSSGNVWVRACNVWLPQSPSYNMNVVVHIGKQRLFKPRDCHQILPSSRTKRRPAVLSQFPREKCEWRRATRAGARNLFEETVRRRRDIWRPIPYRTRGTVARPASGHSWRPTSLQWRTRRTAIESSLPVVSAAACNSAGRWARGQARWARDVTIDEHAVRAWPSCCGFWNLVIAHAWKFPQVYGAFLVTHRSLHPVFLHMPLIILNSIRLFLLCAFVSLCFGLSTSSFISSFILAPCWAEEPMLIIMTFILKFVLKQNNIVFFIFLSWQRLT